MWCGVAPFKSGVAFSLQLMTRKTTKAKLSENGTYREEFRDGQLLYGVGWHASFVNGVSSPIVYLNVLQRYDGLEILTVA